MIGLPASILVPKTYLIGKRPAVTADYQLALLAQFQGSNSSILLIG
jgi:hypothetical protein